MRGVSQLARYEYRWQYNGCAKFDAIVEWCATNCTMDGWDYHHETIYFYFGEEYTLFLLRWS